MSSAEETSGIDRREAIRRVSTLLGGVAFVGGSSLLAACEKAREPVAAGTAIGTFSAADIALLDEIAETILPETKTPGAKAAKVGPFMALMVTDTYEPKDQQVFRDGLQKLNAASQKANNKSFMDSTPQARLALLETLDKEQKTYMDARSAAHAKPDVMKDGTTQPATKTGEPPLPAQGKENAPGGEANGAQVVTADSPTHYFRMMKELTMLGYFTSEIGYTKAQRYVESPGRFDPCVPYTAGETSWAPHA
jgi:hypothetical protein